MEDMFNWSDSMAVNVVILGNCLHEAHLRAERLALAMASEPSIAQHFQAIVAHLVAAGDIFETDVVQRTPKPEPSEVPDGSA